VRRVLRRGGPPNDRWCSASSTVGAARRIRVWLGASSGSRPRLPRCGAAPVRLEGRRRRPDPCSRSANV
jgi:hypothetical protein